MKTIISLLVLFFPYITHALVFTEIMYNPEGSDSGYEWVEVYNDGDSTIDIFGWKFGDKGSPNHAIYEPSHASHPGKGTTTIAPGEYMIIASNATRVLSLFPDIQSSVVDTVMSLVNSGTEISLRKESGGTAVIAHTYTPQEGAENTGSSLQRKSDGVWIVATPTPGEKTKEEVSTTSGGMPAEEVEVRTQTMITDVLIPEQIRVGVPFEGEIEVYGYRGEYRSGGLFRIVFGDGTEHTQEKPGEFTHTYVHPGTYALVFEYYFNRYIDAPEVQRQYVVTVTEPKLLSREGMLYNESDMDIDISKSDSSFPKGTIILAGSAIPLPKESSVVYEKEKVVKATPQIVYVPKEVVEEKQEEQPLVANVATAVEDNEENPLWLFILALIALVFVTVYATKRFHLTPPPKEEAQEGEEEITIIGLEE